MKMKRNHGMFYVLPKKKKSFFKITKFNIQLFWKQIIGINL